MKNKTLSIVMTLAIMVFSVGIFTLNTDTCAAAITAPTGTGLPETANLTLSIGNVIKLVIGIVGGLAVLMIVISGIMYIASAGDSSKVETAKNMLLYSIIGLVVALLAWVIVNAVINSLK